MTVAVPDGMGNPNPDAYGPNVSAEYGGDARIDFYVLDLGQVVYRSGVQRIPSRRSRGRFCRAGCRTPTRMAPRANRRAASCWSIGRAWQMR